MSILRVNAITTIKQSNIYSFIHFDPLRAISIIQLRYNYESNGRPWCYRWVLKVKQSYEKVFHSFFIITFLQLSRLIPWETYVSACMGRLQWYHIVIENGCETAFSFCFTELVRKHETHTLNTPPTHSPSPIFNHYEKIYHKSTERTRSSRYIFFKFIHLSYDFWAIMPIGDGCHFPLTVPSSR